MIKFCVVTLFSVFLNIGVLAAGYGQVLVTPTTVTKLELFDEVSLVVQLKNNASRDYYATIAGTVDFISTKQGQKINEGDLILAIDQDLAKANKTQAESALKLAELSYDRDKRLFSRKIISEETLETSGVNRQKAAADLASTNKSYKDMIITAPFSGEVGVIKARVGDKVAIGDYLFSLIADSAKSAFIELPAALFGKVGSNTEAIIKYGDNEKLFGYVESVSQYLSNNGTIIAKAIIEDPGKKILHDSYQQITLIINKHQGTVVPEKAVLKNDQGNFIYQIAKDNIVKRVYINLGTRTNDFIEVISDKITEGDTIVLEGLTKVQDGTNVKVTDK